MRLRHLPQVRQLIGFLCWEPRSVWFKNSVSNPTWVPTALYTVHQALWGRQEVPDNTSGACPVISVIPQSLSPHSGLPIQHESWGPVLSWELSISREALSAVRAHGQPLASASHDGFCLGVSGKRCAEVSHQSHAYNPKSELS